MFNIGDKIIYGKHTGRVVGYKFVGQNNLEYNIAFDNTNLLPNTMFVPENHVKPFILPKLPDSSDLEYPKRKYHDSRYDCPNCGTPWHKVESPIFGKKEIWYDCVSCNKTKEQIMKDNKSNNYNEELLREFEYMIGD